MLIILYLLLLTLINLSLTLSPNDVDPNWLTLATGTSNSELAENISPISHPVQVLESRQPQDENHKRKKGGYIRTKEVKDKQKLYWTPERRLEQSKKFSKIQSGRITSEETKAKISNRHKGSKRNQSTKEKMRKSHLGLKPSEATKRKIRETLKQTFAKKRKEKQDSQGG